MNDSLWRRFWYGGWKDGLYRDALPKVWTRYFKLNSCPDIGGLRGRATIMGFHICWGPTSPDTFNPSREVFAIFRSRRRIVR